MLWAVQNDLAPHLKGVPAIDEYGGIHPAYSRAIGATSMNDINTSQINGEQTLAYNFDKDVIDNTRSTAEQNGYDTSGLSDEEIDDCLSSIPRSELYKIKKIYDRLPNASKQNLADQEKEDMLKTSRELRSAIKQQFDRSACKYKIGNRP